MSSLTRHLLRKGIVDPAAGDAAVILAGEKDFVLPPAVMPGYERHADDLTVEVVPGCGHFVHEERPEVVLRAARELFAR